MELIFAEKFIYLEDNYFDAIALHSTGIYLFKVCKVSGQIYVDENQNQWESVKESEVRVFRNPCKQCVREVKAFAQDFELPLNAVKPFVIFSSSTRLMTKDRKANHIFLAKVNTLNELLRQVVTRSKEKFRQEELNDLIYDLTYDGDDFDAFAKNPTDKQFKPAERVHSEFDTAILFHEPKTVVSQAQLDRIACSKYLAASSTHFVRRSITYSVLTIVLLLLAGNFRVFGFSTFLLSIYYSYKMLTSGESKGRFRYAWYLVLASHAVVITLIAVPTLVKMGVIK